MVPFEAQAVGTPVVTTDVGMAGALAGRPGVHVAPPFDAARLADAISAALAEPRRREPLGAEWTIRTAVDSIEQALAQAARSRPDPRPRTAWTRTRRAVGLLAERLVPPSPDGIRSVNLATTYYCNSRCTMCSIWELYRRDRSRAAAELSLEDIRAIFSSRRFLGLQAIALTGGEPFLRRDLVEMAGYFLTRHPGAAIVIPTDSVSPKLTLRSVERIVDRYAPGRDRFSITVSLDGLRDMHNRQRGLDCFDNALEVIEGLGALEVSVQVSYTITPLNSGDILATYRLARERGASFSVQFGQSSTHYYGDRSVARSPWSADELRRVQAQIAQIADDRWAELGTKSRLTDTTDYFLRRMVDYQSSPRRIFTCYSGTHSVFIDPYGDVYPCLMLDRKLGNAKRDGFDAVWDGPEAAAVRRFIAERKCACWTPCEAGPSLGRSLSPQLSALVKLHRKERASSCA
jgi:MoaA/NifB/PqqE/SkfB family radical SAM enzyme